MEYRDKEVYFYQYCKTCIYLDLDASEEPCNECLHNTTNTHSHRPTHWEEKEEK